MELEVSNVKSYVDVGSIKQPVVGQNKSTADLRLREGEVNILAGLTRQQDTQSMNGIPGLVDVPVLGKVLFGNSHTEKDRGDLMIALVPHIVRTPDYTPENLRGIASGVDQRLRLTYAPKSERTARPQPEVPAAAPVTPTPTASPATPAPAATAPATTAPAAVAPAAAERVAPQVTASATVPNPQPKTRTLDVVTPAVAPMTSPAEAKISERHPEPALTKVALPVPSPKPAGKVGIAKSVKVSSRGRKVNKLRGGKRATPKLKAKPAAEPASRAKTRRRATPPEVHAPMPAAAEAQLATWADSPAGFRQVLDGAEDRDPARSMLHEPVPSQVRVTVIPIQPEPLRSPADRAELPHDNLEGSMVVGAVAAALYGWFRWAKFKWTPTRQTENQGAATKSF